MFSKLQRADGRILFPGIYVQRKRIAGGKTIEGFFADILEAFRELGVRVPKDVAVIIYQDIQTLESKWPTGTCLEMFPDYVWENALELLFGRISQRRSQAVTVTVPTHLKIGDTA